MPHVTHPDLPDGPVTVRLGGAEPFTSTAKGHVLNVPAEQVAAYLDAFPTSTRTADKKD